MIHRILLPALLTTWGMVSFPSGNASAQGNPATLTGNPTRGEGFFNAYTCYGCHGYTGETGSTGVRLNPPRLNQSGFIAYLRNPPNPTRMPPYQQEEVTDQNLADIYAFLTSLDSGSPEAEDIDLLQEIIEELD